MNFKYTFRVFILQQASFGGPAVSKKQYEFMCLL